MSPSPSMRAELPQHNVHAYEAVAVDANGTPIHVLVYDFDNVVPEGSPIPPRMRISLGCDGPCDMREAYKVYAMELITRGYLF